ncbi:protein mono-ADP-ribosyltransferase PARP14 [Rhinichthys klamathensis goyatoka]|uniref:protein mono-ADP-ribosyltransferase PARP14 n=1 Tax=Rhinichthys klamathensis goyatoka TaxID=3034132 RepID=UPI0024B4C87A|nr:protein mono-ADP-ribosyltransferase PARP14 [Rhinichthys klamathensis goyatoka]
MEEKSLILEGLPDDFDRVKSKVELYFKNKRRSGGEIEQIREHQDDKRKALLIYMREEDLKKVLDKRIHKVDFKSKGTVEVTVKLPEDTKSKKIKPQVLPKPKLEKSALLKSLPAPANQVSAVGQPATEIKDHKGLTIMLLLLVFKNIHRFQNINNKTLVTCIYLFIIQTMRRIQKYQIF